MRAILHLPNSEEMRKTLEKRIAKVHADYILQSIKCLTCPEEQKQLLLDAVKKTIKNRLSEDTI